MDAVWGGRLLPYLEQEAIWREIADAYAAGPSPGALHLGNYEGRQPTVSRCPSPQVGYSTSVHFLSYGTEATLPALATRAGGD